MAIFSSPAEVYLRGNGTAGPYTVPFPIFVSSSKHYITVEIIDSQGQVSQLTEGQDYSVTLQQVGGFITLMGTINPFPDATKIIHIYSSVDLTLPLKVATGTGVTGDQFNNYIARIYAILAQLQDCCEKSVHSAFDFVNGLYNHYDVKDLKPDEMLALDHLGKTIISTGLSKKALDDQLKQLNTLVSNANSVLTNAQTTAQTAQGLAQQAQSLLGTVLSTLNKLQTDLADFNSKYPQLSKLAQQIPDASTLQSGMGLVVDGGQWGPHKVLQPSDLHQGRVLGADSIGQMTQFRVLEVEGQYKPGEYLAVTRTDGDRVFATAAQPPSGGGSGGGNISFAGEPEGTGVVAGVGGITDMRPVLNIAPTYMPNGYHMFPSIVLPSNFNPAAAYQLVAVFDPNKKEVTFMAQNTGGGGSAVAPTPLADDQILVGKNGQPTPQNNPLIEFMPGKTPPDESVPSWSASDGKFLPKNIKPVPDAVNRMLLAHALLSDPNLSMNGNDIVAGNSFEVVFPLNGKPHIETVNAGTLYTATPDKANVQYLYYDPAQLQIVLSNTEPTSGIVRIAQIVTNPDNTMHIVPDYSNADDLLDQLDYYMESLGTRAYDVVIQIRTANSISFDTTRHHPYMVGYNINPKSTTNKNEISIRNINTIYYIDSNFTELHAPTQFGTIRAIDDQGNVITGSTNHVLYVVYYNADGTMYLMPVKTGDDTAANNDWSVLIANHQITINKPSQLDTPGVAMLGYIDVDGTPRFRKFYNVEYNFGVGSHSLTTLPLPVPSDDGKFLTVKNGALELTSSAMLDDISKVPNGMFLYKDSTGHIVGKSSVPAYTGGYGIIDYGAIVYMLDYAAGTMTVQNKISGQYYPTINVATKSNTRLTVELTVDQPLAFTAIDVTKRGVQLIITYSSDGAYHVERIADITPTTSYPYIVSGLLEGLDFTHGGIFILQFYAT